MKKRPIDTLLGSLVYALYMMLSCLVIMFVEILAIKIANLFVVVDNFSTSVIRAVIYTLGVNALLAIIAFHEGYKAARPAPIATAISATVATLIHSLFALLFSFEAFCAGGVRSIAILVKFGKTINSPLFAGTLDRFDIIPFFFINSAIYVAVMIIANKLGASHRLKVRDEMNIGAHRDMPE
ncbi:MAG: hypothetical protein E7649_01095 [Ruminococcaceae bacterium]|nr:hypothetical protein [Oscillospiraceae bacterium]